MTTRKVFVSGDSLQRLEAFIRFDSDPTAPQANCEECGAPIPIELTRCSRCNQAA